MLRSEGRVSMKSTNPMECCKDLRIQIKRKPIKDKILYRSSEGKNEKGRFKPYNSLQAFLMR